MSWRRLLSRSFLPIADFLFPQSCLACHQHTSHPLCRACLPALADAEHYCRGCAHLLDEPMLLCRSCSNKGVFFHHATPALDDSLAAEVLAHKFLTSLYLAEALAGYLALQFLKMGWRFPDFITYIPITRFGPNPHALLARNFGKIIDRPVENVLCYKLRAPLTEHPYELTHRKFIPRKRILLIALTPQPIQEAAEVLVQFAPKRLNALTLTS